MGTIFLSEQNLLAIVEQLTVRASWAVAAATIGASEALMYQYLDKSRKAEAVRDESSPFYITWRDEANYWHRHCARARKDNLLSLSALVADQLKCGHEEVCFDPSSGHPIQKLNEKYLHRDDAWFIANGLDPAIDKYEWVEHEDELGEITREPVWLTRRVEMAASLKAVALRGLLPKTFGEKAEVNHHVNGAVTHIIEPAKFIPRAERLAIERGDVVDATFEEVPPERADIAELRAAWEAKKNDPNRVTQPRGVVRKADGTPVGATVIDPPDDVPIEKPIVPLDQHPRSYQRPTPQPAPQPPRGSYPAHSDPRGKIAMKVR